MKSALKKRTKKPPGLQYGMNTTLHHTCTGIMTCVTYYQYDMLYHFNQFYYQFCRGDSWLSYDNEKSITIKSEFAFDQGLAGVMTWSIETDDFLGMCKGPKFPLLRTINHALYRREKGLDSTVSTVSAVSTASTVSTDNTTDSTAPTATPGGFLALVISLIIAVITLQLLSQRM